MNEARRRLIDRLEVRSASKFYERHYALYQASMTLTGGEVTALLGPNGAGKSTLLGLLATLVEPSSGTLRAFAGERSVSREWWRARTGLVAHESMLQRELTGREQLRLVAALKGVSEALVDDELRRVELVADADRSIGTYSRGMRQRLAIARALLGDPDIVLLDEPSTGLDARSRSMLWALLRALAGEGRIVAVVTHDFDAPDGTFDRAVVLAAGRVVDDRAAPGPLSSVYRTALSEAR